jgi:hypothetical protein
VKRDWKKLLELERQAHALTKDELKDLRKDYSKVTGWLRDLAEKV